MVMANNKNILLTSAAWPKFDVVELTEFDWLRAKTAGLKRRDTFPPHFVKMQWMHDYSKRLTSLESVVQENFEDRAVLVALTFR